MSDTGRQIRAHCSKTVSKVCVSDSAAELPWRWRESVMMMMMMMIVTMAGNDDDRPRRSCENRAGRRRYKHRPRHARTALDAWGVPRVEISVHCQSAIPSAGRNSLPPALRSPELSQNVITCALNTHLLSTARHRFTRFPRRIQNALTDFLTAKRTMVFDIVRFVYILR